MALSPRLDLRQTQSLVMTPQLQQAIRLLALSNLEVEAFLAEEIERNPLLEIGEREAPDGEPREGLSANGNADDVSDGAPDAAADAGADSLIAAGAGESDAPLDMDLGADVFHHDCVADGGTAGPGSAAAGGSLPDEGPGLEERLVDTPSLADHLHAQIGLMASGALLFAARHLIDQVDESGYLRADLADVARDLGLSPTVVEEALALVQQCDPAGVGARDLAECLAIQAREADRYDPCMARLIANLDLVARGDWPRLRRLCAVDDEDLADMMRELRGYDPRPGLRFGSAPADPVVPDLFVRRRGEGFLVELNADTLPRLVVNRSYQVELGRAGQDKATRAWLGEKLADARWLMRTLDQRQKTILKVAAEIVEQQQGFFRHGVAHLRPLTLRAVAEAIDMHESTVSRVTSQKYLACARGTFELKYFFTSSIQSADGGEAVSAETVKAAIRTLVDGEPADAILSDDRLVELLREKGFDIARRTVAKYREAMGIGSSVQRRRQKSMA